MKIQTFRNAVLPLIALLALLAYILACTSFSPDDSKVLYPAFDGTNGAVGIAVYDRDSRRSQMLLVPSVLPRGTNNSVEATLLRPQWLADGHRMLVAWPANGADKEGLNLALLAWDKRAPFRLFSLPEVKDAGARLIMPLGIVGERVFVMENDQTLVRLDLASGEIVRRELVETNQQISVYAGPDGKSLFYFVEHEATCGRIDPESFVRTPVLSFTNQLADGSFLGFDQSWKRLAFIETRDGAAQLVVLQTGGPAFTRSLGTTNEELSFSSAGFRGDLLVTSYCREIRNRRGLEFGLMEIPLSEAPVRETVLMRTTGSGADMAAFQFQASLSHDGKTAAVASTLLGCEGKASITEKDVALFLVDLSSRSRAVTKIPAVIMPERTKRLN